MSEIRYNRLNDTHVIIAPERLRRPNLGIKKTASQQEDGECPFCEGNESMTPHEIFALRQNSGPDTVGWKTRVIPNLYKAVQIEAPYRHHYALFEYWEGFGAHEVIVDTPRHNASMTEWEFQEIINWLKTLSNRISDLRRDGRIAYISLFKNEGEEAGATQAHPHTQLIALPMIPKKHQEYFERAHTFFIEHGHAFLDDIVNHEQEDAKRVILQEDGVVAYAPFASEFPFEVIIALKNSPRQLDKLTGLEIETLSNAVKKIMQALKAEMGSFDFNVSIATPPLQENGFANDLLEKASQSNRFYIRIMPRIYKLAGFEVSSGTNINPVAPELVAKLLKEKINVQ